MYNKILLIGYGNTLREDDGFGVYIAEALSNCAAYECETAHQLTPELAITIAKFSRIIFVDVNMRNSGGVFAVPIENSDNAFNHSFSPHSLMNLTTKLYGGKREYEIFSVGGVSFEYRESLTPPVKQAAEVLVSFLTIF